MNLALIFLFFFALSFPLSRAAADKNAARQLKELPAQTLNSVPAPKISDLKKDIVLVDFWATWCEPCKESLPVYEELYKKWKDKGLRVVAFNVDDNRKEAEAFLKKNPLHFPIFYDGDRKYVDLFGIQAVPTLLLFDQNLKLQETYRGYTPNKIESLKKKIETQLKNLKNQ